MRFGEQYKKGIPIEVVPLAYLPIKMKIEENFGGSVELRMAKVKAVSVLFIDNWLFILEDIAHEEYGFQEYNLTFCILINRVPF